MRYDELCEYPEKIIDEIIEHTELSPKIFELVKKYYINFLHKPTYYTPNFSQKDIEDISEITKLTTERFDLDY